MEFGRLTVKALPHCSRISGVSNPDCSRTTIFCVLRYFKLREKYHHTVDLFRLDELGVAQDVLVDLSTAFLISL